MKTPQSMKQQSPTNVKQREEKYAAEWLRVSTPQQVKDGGLETARHITQQIAERNGLTMKAEWVIELPGISGARTRLTKQMQQLIRLITVAGCRHVVMKEISRLMRADHFGDYGILDIFKEYKVHLHTPQQSFDLSNPVQATAFQLGLIIASQEREQIRERTYGRRLVLRDTGRCGSHDNTLGLGIGYNREKEYYFPITKNGEGINEADQALRLFQLFTSGETNFRRLTLKTGISLNRIRKILTDTCYVGIRTYDQQVDPKLNVYNDDDTLRYQVPVKLEEPIKVPMRGFKAEPILYETIVPEDMFAHAQQLLSFKRENDLRGARVEEDKDPYLFRGFLRCDACDANMICLPLQKAKYYACRNTTGQRRVHLDGSGYWRVPYGTCRSPRIQLKILDPMLELVVTEKLSNPAFLYKLLENRRDELNSDDIRRRTESLRAEIKQTEASINRAQTEWIKGRFDNENEYEQVRASLIAQLDEQNKALAACSTSIPKLSRDYLASRAKCFAAWDTLPRGDQRQILKTICPRFRVRLDGNGKKGRGAMTSAEIKGFWLSLVGLEAFGGSTKASNAEPAYFSQVSEGIVSAARSRASTGP